jgi:hypothetical protein
VAATRNPECDAKDPTLMVPAEAAIMRKKIEAVFRIARDKGAAAVLEGSRAQATRTLSCRRSVAARSAARPITWRCSSRP